MKGLMELYLKWTDKKGKVYLLGKLFKESGLYYFYINYDGLKDAIAHGCIGIGNFDLKRKKYVDGDIFTFFQHRIPDEDSVKAKGFLKKNNLKNYEPMDILKITKGITATDRYFLDEKEE